MHNWPTTTVLPDEHGIPYVPHPPCDSCDDGRLPARCVECDVELQPTETAHVDDTVNPGEMCRVHCGCVLRGVA